MDRKPIPGFEGFYEATADGRIWSLWTGRFLKPAPTSSGYLSVQLYDGTAPKSAASHTVHSLIALTFIGPRPDGHEIDHVDADKRNNAAANLEYVTCRENMRRARASGCFPEEQVRPVGRKSGYRKLQAAQIREIRAYFFHVPRRGLVRGLARIFRVDAATIRDIQIGRHYRNVESFGNFGIFGPPRALAGAKRDRMTLRVA